MQKNHVSWLAGAGLLLIVVGLFGAFYAAPRFLKTMVIESTVLKDDSEALKRWTILPQPMFYKIYVFHVTNAAAVDKGERPVLVEKGPYHYDVYRERVDVKFHPEDDTVSYYDKSNFVFNKAKSGCFSEEDEVTVLNAPIVGTSLLLLKLMPMALSVFNEALPYLTTTKGAFVTAKVRDILFDGLVVNCSYPESMFPVGPVCAGLKQKAPVTFRQNPGSQNFYFSMLSHLNGTSKDRVRINRGQKDFTLLGKIVSFRDSTIIDVWRPNSTCNMVNGTDTTIFRPFVDRTMTLQIFQSTSCRSMYATFDYESSYAGISTLHFKADPNMFASGRDYPPNRCFCPMPSDDDDDSDEEEAGDKGKGGKGGGGGAGGGDGGGSEEDDGGGRGGGDDGGGEQPAEGGGGDGGNAAEGGDGGGGGGEGGGGEAAAEETGGGDAGRGDGGEKAAEEGGAGAEADPVELVGAWTWDRTFRRNKRAAAKKAKTPDERDAKPCLLKGCLDVSKCFGSPVIISLPHFYLGDETYQTYPIGLKPNKVKHETFLDMEPITGTPIRGSKRIQLNMNVKRVEEVSLMRTVSEGMFPMLWVEEGVILEGQNLQMVVSAMRWVQVLLATPWVLVGLGVVTLAGAALLFSHITGKIVLPGINIASATDSRRGLDSGLRGGREVAPMPHNNYGYGNNYNNAIQSNKVLLLGVTEAPMKGIPTRYITGADGNALNGAGGAGVGGGGGGRGMGLYGNQQGGGGMVMVNGAKNAFNSSSVLMGVDNRIQNAHGMRGIAPTYMTKPSGAASVYASGFLVQRKPPHNY